VRGTYNTPRPFANIYSVYVCSGARSESLAIKLQSSFRTLLRNAQYKIRPEWHLLKLRGMAIFAGVLSGDRAWFGEERVGFWSTLDGPGFNAAGPIADPLLSDQGQQTTLHLVVVDVMAMMIPGEPELQGVLETELARSRVGALRRAA